MDCLEKFVISFAMLFGIASSPAFAQKCKQVRLAANQIRVTQPHVSLQDSLMAVSMNLNLDSLLLPSNMRLIYTPMYEKINDEWNVILANRYFGLQSNKAYYLSLAIDDETVEVMPLSGRVRVFAIDGKLVYQNPSEAVETVMHRLFSGCYIIQVTPPGGECHSVKISVK